MTEAPPDPTPKSQGAPPPIGAFSRYDGCRAFLALALVLTGFSCAGALVLLWYTHRYPELDAIQMPQGLLLRALFFGVLAAWSALGLWRLRESMPAAPHRPSRRRLPLGLVGLVTALLGLIASILAYHVADYPWAAPDEVHHLVVARNLAQHGSYASGHPESGLKYFDSFDSVGPAVLGPIALAFKGAGVSLGVARGVMVAYFLALSVAAFVFVRRLFGMWSAVTSMALLFGTFSSIYLGRTLYGEVPAFAWLLFGLVAWRRALLTPAWTGWGLVAGVLFALAVLSKTIIVLVVFSALGAWAYDRATFQRIRWQHVAGPAIGGLVVLGVWTVFQRVHGAGQVDEGGVLAIYQHYLLFGISSTPFAVVNSVAFNPVAHGVWAVVAVITAPLVFRRRYDPAAVVLYLYALFLLFWWYFFTPGQLHRYLWNAYAILAIFSGPWLVTLIRKALARENRIALRLVCLGAALVMIAPPTRWVLLQSQEILTRREMATERALIEAVEALPDDVAIATTVDRIPGLLNFFTGRDVVAGESAGPLLDRHDVVIVRDSSENEVYKSSGVALKPAGKFVLLSGKRPLE